MLDGLRVLLSQTQNQSRPLATLPESGSPEDFFFFFKIYSIHLTLQQAFCRIEQFIHEHLKFLTILLKTNDFYAYNFGSHANMDITT